MDQLTEVDYLKWRLKIEEMHHSETKLKSSKISLQIMDKDLEILQLRKGLYKYSIKNLEDNTELLKKEYQEIKKGLEDKLGYSLNSCVIDEIDFTVKKLEE